VTIVKARSNGKAYRKCAQPLTGDRMLSSRCSPTRRKTKQIDALGDGHGFLRGGQFERHDRPISVTAPNGNTAPMRFDDGAADRQPDAQSGSFRRAERREQAVAEFVRESRAIVFDIDHDIIAAQFGADCQSAFVLPIHRFDGSATVSY
jgi:hypothetical protein